MRGTRALPETLLKGLLRSRAAIALMVLAVPWLALCILGLLWLAERDALIPFLGVTFLVLLVLRLAQVVFRRRAARAAAKSPAPEIEPLVAPNPEWAPRELAVFREICQEIANRLPSPLPWADIRPLAFDVVEQAAVRLSNGRKHALDFSLPEALLLADRVLMRARQGMHDYVPFSDQVSLRALLWLFQKRDYVKGAATWGIRAHRLFRLATNPTAAIARELQNIIIGEATEDVKVVAFANAQRALLEEVARAAIDLHTGHLRFSDEELLQIELASEGIDQRIVAQADEPLRMTVVGQVSAGKSTLINALAREVLAETDVAPTTPGATRHDLEIAGLPHRVIDTRGIDGSTPTDEALLEEMLRSDLVLWVVRANRPARAPDVALMERLERSLDAMPDRRRPPVIVVATAMDALLPGWPFPENILPDGDLEKVAQAVSAIAADMKVRHVIPLVAEVPDWNIELCVSAIADAAAQAIMTQRNRRRLEGLARAGGLARELRRTVDGSAALTQTALGRIFGDSGKDR